MIRVFGGASKMSPVSSSSLKPSVGGWASEDLASELELLADLAAVVCFGRLRKAPLVEEVDCVFESSVLRLVLVRVLLVSMFQMRYDVVGLKYCEK